MNPPCPRSTSASTKRGRGRIVAQGAGPAAAAPDDRRRPHGHLRAAGEPGRGPGNARSRRRRRRARPALARPSRVCGRTPPRLPARLANTPPATPPSERGPVGRAFLDGHALERKLEHRRHDPQPERAARPAAERAAAIRLEPERTDQLERVAQPVGHSFEHCPHQGPAVVPELDPDEGPARIGVGVRCPLAGQVGQEKAGRPTPRANARPRRRARRTGRRAPRDPAARQASRRRRA